MVDSRQWSVVGNSVFALSTLYSLLSTAHPFPYIIGGINVACNAWRMSNAMREAALLGCGDVPPKTPRAEVEGKGIGRGNEQGIRAAACVIRRNDRSG